MSLGRRLGRGFGALLGGWALWRLVGPEVPRHYSTPQEAPARVPGRTVLVGNREHFVREAGPENGSPVVLIHGWSFDGIMTFYKVIPALAERFRVIVPDMRNHGGSPWVRGRYDPVDLADEVAGLLRAVGVRNATVVGYSLGGLVTQELARRHRDLVGHMVLAGTAAWPVPRRRRLIRLGFWLARIVARISTIEGAWITTRILVRSSSLSAEHERWMYEALLRRDSNLFYEAGAAVWRFDSRPWVSSLPQSATVVIPTDDRLIPAFAQRQLAELLRDAEVIELPGAGHESILSHGDEYAKLLTRIVEARQEG